MDKKLNQLCLAAALKRQDPVTGFIYFDEKNPFADTKLIPILENIAFVLALFNQKQTESFHLGEKLLFKLLCYHKGGNFSKYMHEFPDMSSPYVGIWVYPYLFKISEWFKLYLNKTLLSQCQQVIDGIRGYARTLEPYRHLEPLLKAIKGESIEPLNGSWEAAFALQLLPSEAVIEERVKFLERGHLKLSCFDFMAASSPFPPFLLEDHPLHLKLSLFYHPFEKQLLTNPIYQKFFDKGLVWTSSDGNEHVISWDMCEEEEEWFKGSLELHQEFNLYFPKQMKVIQWEAKGTYFLKNEPVIIEGCERRFELFSNVNLALCMQKRGGELFDELSLCLKVERSGPFKIRLRQL